MKKRQKLLTDEQWELVGPLLPEPRRRKNNRGRPWASNRGCLEDILWILQTGAAYSVFDSAVYRNRDAEWLFPQENAISHDDAMARLESKTL